MTILNSVRFIQAINVLFSVIFTRIFIVILFISCPVSVYAAGNYNTGAFYFANGDYNTAMQIWAPLAQEGNPAAQYSMGLLYDQGMGVKKDPQTALNYFQAAVKQNLSAAQYYLGIKYYAGLGVKKDPQRALKLIRRAAEQDHLQAQFQMGYFYDQGIGTAVNPKKATQWYIRAAENGFGPAQHALAARYLSGRGTPLNLKQGVFWLQKAVDQNDLNAMRDLGFLYYQGMGIKKDWAQARKILSDPAEEGSALAQYVLGDMYALGGHGVKQNKARARYWFSKAKQSGNKDAEQRLKQLSGSSSDKTIKAAINKPVTKSSNSSTLDNKHFMQLANNNYTIQLLQARHFQSIRKLVQQFHDNQTYVLKITRNNEILYVLSYGRYANYNAAKQGIKHLPIAFQLKSAPWIRKVGQIKKLLYQQER